MHASSKAHHVPAAGRPTHARWRVLLAATVLAGSGSVFAATCTQISDLGTLMPAATGTFGNAFSGPAEFSDCWDFSLAALSNVNGSATATNADFWFLPRNIGVQSIALWDLLTGAQIGATDTTPDSFGFANLAAGSYELVVSGYSTLGFGTATYAGTLVATPVGTVPEPSGAALLALALGAAALARRRAVAPQR